ncbi:hypothetical protein N0V88_002667 [Collariella sp. IMI 366227]|nr:hypothetical protein N0V88_002667 [Collariella sp. IMI 366227]
MVISRLKILEEEAQAFASVYGKFSKAGDDTKRRFTIWAEDLKNWAEITTWDLKQSRVPQHRSFSPNISTSGPRDGDLYQTPESCLGGYKRATSHLKALMNEVDLGNDDPKRNNILSIIRVFENNSDKLDQAVESGFQRENELSPLTTQSGEQSATATTSNPDSQPKVDDNQQSKQRPAPSSTKRRRRTMTIDLDSSFSQEPIKSRIVTLKVPIRRQTSAASATTLPETRCLRQLRSRKGKQREI